MNDSKPKVSVIVVNYNGSEHLPTCIESLQAQTLADQMEIILVDNGSTENTEELVRPYAVTLIKISKNGALIKAMNLGARAGSGSFLFFIGNDMYFEPDCVEKMLQVLESDETIFSSDARQRTYDGQHLLHVGTVLRPASCWHFQYPGMRVDVLVDVPHQIDIPFSSGACCMVRKAMFEKIGGFDDTFIFANWEDVDLCWRAWLHGWRSVYVPEAIAYHKHGADCGKEAERRQARGDPNYRLFLQYCYMNNKVRFAMKVMPLGDSVKMFLQQHVLALYHAVKGKPYLAYYCLRAWWKNLLELGEILSARREAFRHAVTSSKAIRQRFWVDDQGGNLLRPAPLDRGETSIDALH